MGSRIRRARGVTALELMVVVGVAAVLATLAMPSFARMRRAASLSAATNQLLWALNFARSSAVLNSTPVTLCLSGGWEVLRGISGDRAALDGWSSISPAGASCTQPAAAPLLHAFTLPEDVSVHGTRAAVTFWPVARAGTTSTFDLCGIGSGTSMAGRAVVVSQTGRSRVATEDAACAP